LHRESLAAVTSRLHHHGFCQASRSLLVRLTQIRESRPLPNGRRVLTLRSGATLMTSRRFAAAFKTALDR